MSFILASRGGLGHVYSRHYPVAADCLLAQLHGQCLALDPACPHELRVPLRIGFAGLLGAREAWAKLVGGLLETLATQHSCCVYFHWVPILPWRAWGGTVEKAAQSQRHLTPRVVTARGACRNAGLCVHLRCLHTFHPQTCGSACAFRRRFFAADLAGDLQPARQGVLFVMASLCVLLGISLAALAIPQAPDTVDGRDVGVPCAVPLTQALRGSVVLVIAKECSRLEHDIISWGKKHILAQRIVTLPCGTPEQIGWDLDGAKPLLVKAVAAGSPAQSVGIAPGSRVCEIAGRCMSANEEVRDLGLMSRSSGSGFHDNSAKGDAVVVTVAGSPLPPGSDRSFLALRQRVANGASRLCPLVHYVMIDMCMYFLTDFAQAKDLSTMELWKLLVLHFPQSLIIMLTLNQIQRFNGATRKLVAMLHEVAVYDDLTDGMRQRIEAFQSLATASAHQMCLYVFGIAVSKRFVWNMAISALGYIRAGPWLLEAVGPGFFKQERGRSGGHPAEQVCADVGTG
eukprot:CAMPEP_0179012710 /NCGR_PEP_ID=MMETSP0796-20121207/1346_1 /TAXON_ID=73915 /ORGANISM="Pyrodinium bahamense, Strain pbaha01" /LENGTH=512 /DNA_ID=CAMNT_0020708181 /DNA_START=146 /DNA_END=1685 /DNA_ORIENTATION=+